MEKLTLTLTVAEVNTILNSLGHLPYFEVAELIHKVREQGDSQLKAAPAAEEEEPEVAQPSAFDLTDES